MEDINKTIQEPIGITEIYIEYPGQTGLVKAVLATNKLDKVTTETGFPEAYVKAKNGSQVTTPVSTDLNKNTIALRDYAGRLIAADPDPVTRKHVATVGYVNDKFNGANKAEAFIDYFSMVQELNILDNSKYKIGQNIMIVALNVPDLWISGVTDTNIIYNYTNDKDFISVLSTQGFVQVGYYLLSALETQKVDLTDYDTKEEVDNKIAAINIRNGEGEASIKSPDVENQYEDVEGFPEGRLNKVIGTQGVAFGAAHKVMKRGGVALGAYANLRTRFSAGIGYVNYTAIGTDDTVETGYGDGNVGIGDGNAITSKGGSVAIGTGNKIGYIIRLTKEERDEIIANKRDPATQEKVNGRTYGGYREDTIYVQQISITSSGRSSYKLLTEQRLQTGAYWTDPNTTVSYVDENGTTKTYIAICKLSSKNNSGTDEFVGAVALGYGNRVTDTGAVATGAGTWADGFASFSAGEDTEAHGNRCFVSGYDNFIYSNNGFVAGSHHNVTGGGHDDITLFGRWSDAKENLLFAIGNGTDNNNRYNIFEIFKDNTINIPGYVKNTDVSKNGKPGLLALYGESNGWGYGLYNRNGVIYITPVTNSEINSRQPNPNAGSSLSNQPNFKPITRATIDYAVKKALTEDKLATTDYAWTDEEKVTARANLGIASGTKFYAHKFYKDFDVYTIISTSPNLQYAYFLNGDDPDTGVSDANFGMIINTGYILDAYKEIEDINYMEPQLVKSAEGYKTDIRTFLFGYAERYVYGIYELAGENVSSIFSKDYYGPPLESGMWEDYTGNEFEGVQNIKVIKPDYTSEL